MRAEDFLNGATAPAVPSAEEFLGQPESSSMLRRGIADPAISLLKGAIAVPEAAVGLANIPTMGLAGKFAEGIGFRPKDARAELDTWYSPEQQSANKRVQDAKGFFPTVQAAVENPSVIGHTVAESVPPMMGGAAIARGLLGAGGGALARSVGATAAPTIAGAAGEGIVGTGLASEQIRQQTPTGTLTPEQLGYIGASGIGTALIGAAGGSAIRKIGLSDVDTMLAGGVGTAGTRGMPARVLGGAVSEGAEETLQSAQDQAWQNLALNKPVTEGVPEQAAMGLLSGAVMGSAGGIVPQRQAAQQPPGPLQKAADAAATTPSTIPQEEGQGIPQEEGVPPATISAGTIPQTQQPAAGIAAAVQNTPAAPGTPIVPVSTAAPPTTTTQAEPAGVPVSQPQEGAVSRGNETEIAQPAEPGQQAQPAQAADSAAAEQEWRDFVATEGRDIGPRQLAVILGQFMARRRQASGIEAATGGVENARQREVAANRMAVLESLPLTTTGNTMRRYATALRNAGIRDYRVSPEERQMIARRIDARDTLQPLEQNPTNELTLPEKREAKAVAPTVPRMDALRRKMATPGARVVGNRLLDRHGKRLDTLSAEEVQELAPKTQQEPKKTVAADELDAFIKEEAANLGKRRSMLLSLQAIRKQKQSEDDRADLDALIEAERADLIERRARLQDAHAAAREKKPFVVPPLRTPEQPTTGGRPVEQQATALPLGEFGKRPTVDAIKTPSDAPQQPLSGAGEPQLADESQPPAAPPVPDRIRNFIESAITKLRNISDSLDNVVAARGHGHILATELKDKQGDIDAAKARLAKARAIAAKNGSDVESVIAELGGEPDFEKFAAKQEGRSAAQPDPLAQTFDQWRKAVLDANEYKVRYLRYAGGNEDVASLLAVNGDIDPDNLERLSKNARLAYFRAIIGSPRGELLSLDVYDALNKQEQVEALRHFLGLEDRIDARSQKDAQDRFSKETEKLKPYEGALATAKAEIKRLGALPGPITAKQRALEGRAARLEQAIFEIKNGKEPDGRLLKQAMSAEKSPDISTDIPVDNSDWIGASVTFLSPAGRQKRGSVIRVANGKATVVSAIGQNVVDLSLLKHTKGESTPLKGYPASDTAPGHVKSIDYARNELAHGTPHWYVANALAEDVLGDNSKLSSAAFAYVLSADNQKLWNLIDSVARSLGQRSSNNGDVRRATAEYVAGRGVVEPEREQPKEPPGQDVNMQNRDRSRAASVVQMSDIARNPDYMRLGPSRTPDSGAPMVFAAGDDLSRIPKANFGREDVSVMSDGQRVPFRYAVVDASQVEPSNFADGRANPAFSADRAGTIKALNNGRVAGLRSAYEIGSAGAYQAELASDLANVGISPDAMRATPNPILVRVYSDTANTSGMAAKSQAQGLGMSPAELARQDAPLLDSSVLDVLRPGDIAAADNRDFVRAFVGKLRQSGQDIAGMMTDSGSLSSMGRQRINAALMQAAYGDADLVAELFDSIDTDIKAIGDALKSVAGTWANMRDSAKLGSIAPEADITEPIVSAVRLIQKARRDRLSLSDLVNQRDIETGEAVDDLTAGALRLFYTGQNMTRPTGKDRLVANLERYLELAMATSAGADMFGDKADASRLIQAITKDDTDAGNKVKAEPSSVPAAGPGPGRGRDKAPGQRGAASGNQPLKSGGQGNGGQEAVIVPPVVAPDTPRPELGLLGQTPEEVAASEAAAKARSEAEARAKKESDKARKDAEDRAEIKRRSEFAAETFELGGDAMSNLTGQGDIFGSAPKREPLENLEQLPEDLRFSFAGQQSAAADQFQLARAKQLLAVGASADGVRQQTGWFKNPSDGKWRYEIDDSGASLKAHGFGFGELLDALGKNLTLAEVLDHPALFAAYPSIARSSVDTIDEKSKNNGQLSKNQDGSFTILVNASLDESKALSTLLHEIQHGIQNVEGFASGGNMDQFVEPILRKKVELEKRVFKINALLRKSKGSEYLELLADRAALVDEISRLPDDIGTLEQGYKQYRKLAGEVESRNVQRRQNFTADRRKYSDPIGTQDVAPEDVIVMFNGKDAKDAPAPANTTRASAMAAVGASPADAAVFDMAAEGKSAQEILSFLSKASRRPFNRVLANALSRIGVSSNISVDQQAGWRNVQNRQGARFAASYSQKTDTVSLFTPREAERHILHELIHSASMKAIASGGLAARQMQAIFDYVQKTGTMSDQYGMGNFSRFQNETDAQFKKRALDEFVAELFTNPQFQVRLKQLPAPSGSNLKSVWDWIVRVIANILGMRTKALETALDRALSVGVALLQENAALTAAHGGERFSQEQPFSGRGNIVQRLETATKNMKTGRVNSSRGTIHAITYADARKDAGLGQFVPPGLLVDGFYDPQEDVFYTREAAARLVGLDDMETNKLVQIQSSAGRSAPFSGREVAATPLKPGTKTLMVDGTDRPALNSNGKPIHWSEEGVRNFWRWFGSSRAVDERGRPLVATHMTGEPWTVYDKSKARDSAVWGKGLYLSLENKWVSGAANNEMQLYIRSVNPLDITGPLEEKELETLSDYVGRKVDVVPLLTMEKRSGSVTQGASDAGFDGIIHLGPGSTGRHIVVFTPEQVKSATGNTGAFSEDPDIRYSAEQTSGLTDARIDRLLSQYAYTMNDKRTKAYIAWVNPDDFIMATTPANELRRLESEKTKLSVERMREETQDIQLIGDQDEKNWITSGHEGRHRMMALRDAGVNSVPVVFYAYSGKEREPIRNIYVRPQKHGDTRSASGFFARNLTPINYENEQAIRDEFGKDADIRYSAADNWQQSPVAREVAKAFKAAASSDEKLSWLNPVQTQYHKAERLAQQGKFGFKRVFDLGQKFLSDISRFAIMAENSAPTLFHQIRSAADVKQTIKAGLRGDFGKQHNADIRAIAAPLYEGTLYGGGNPMAGIVWTDEQLRDKFGLTDNQIKLYHEARDAVKVSMDEMAKSLIAKHAKRERVSFDDETTLAGMSQRVAERLEERIADIEQLVGPEAQEEAEAAIADLMELDEKEQAAKVRRDFKRMQESAKADIERLEQTILDVQAIADKAQKLQAAGYFPLMRFGRHTVTAKDENGKVQHFSMHDGIPLVPRSGQAQANLLADALREEHPEWTVETGLMNPELYKLYQGMNIDALQLFSDHLDEDTRKTYQEVIRLATNERSALKRMLKREGTPGFDRDVRRTLASFILSNARYTSSAYNLADMAKAAEDANEDGGDIGAEAVKMYEYVAKPQEEAAKIRGFLFFNFLGGSLAAAMVNATQVPMMTFPRLAQYEQAGKLAARLGQAAKLAIRNPAGIQGDIGEALRRAEENGITAPHQIYEMTATAANNIFTGSRAGSALLRAWGAPFALAESFNRRTTFIAAYQIGRQMTENQLRDAGAASAFEFAEKIVQETQGIYNRGNRVNLGRGKIGATVMTFKQFSIMYLEMFSRLPARQKAIMAGMLILAAGAGGLPFAEDIEDIIDTIGQWLGYRTNTRRAIRRGLADLAGQRAADIAMNGVLSQMGVDLHSRLGLQNIIPGSAIMKPSTTDKSREFQDLLGPAASVVASLGQALQDLATGRPLKAAEALAPVSVQNAVKGARMAATGRAEDMRGKPTIPVSAAEAAAKGIGFNPKAVADYGTAKRDIMQDERLLDVTRERFTAAIVDAIIAGDDEARREALQQVMEWNRRNPDARININPASIRRRVADMRAEGPARVLKSLSPSLRQQAQQELADAR